MELARFRIQRHRLAVHHERPGLAVFTENACNLVTAVHAKLDLRAFASVRAEVEVHRTVDAFAVRAAEAVFVHLQRRHVVKNAHVHGDAGGRAVRKGHVKAAGKARRLFRLARGTVLLAAVRFRLPERHVAFRIHDQLAVHLAVLIRHVHRLVRNQRHALGKFRHVHVNGLTGKHVVVVTGHAALHSRQVSAFHLHFHRSSITHHVAVGVRHHHFHFVGDGIVFAATLLAVFLGGLVQRIGIGQVRAVKAGHVQVPLIRLDGIARQGAVLPDDDTADGDGRHAVRGGDAHAAVGRRGAPAAAAIQGGFVHLEHIVRHGRREIFSLDGDVRIIRIRAGSGRRHGHAVVVLIIRARLHRICGQLHAAVEADVQTPQMVEAVQQVAAAVFVVAAATRGAAAGSGASGGHQVFTKGREEILAADLHTFHLEGRHLFLGIRGVEILQLDGGAILESQDEVVAAAGQRRGIRRKVKDEAPVRSAGDGLCGTSGRLGKTDIGHEGPPKKK